MPIPIGAHSVRGNPNRVRLASGDVVTRAKARSLGAQELGYKSARSYTKEIAGADAKYYKAFAKTEQGKNAIRIAKANGMRPTEFKTLLIAARNGRPHPRSKDVSKRVGNRAYSTFMTDYINDGEIYDIGDT